MWFGGGPSFLASPWIFSELLQLNYNHYFFIVHLVHWDRSQLSFTYQKHHCQFEIQLFAIMAHCNLPQVHQLALHIYHVSFKEDVLKNKGTPSIPHSVKSPQISNVPHHKVKGIATTVISCSSPWWSTLKKLRLELPIKWSVGIDEDINLLQWGRDASSTLSLEAIKSNISGAKTKIWDEVLVVYLCLVSGRGGIDMPNLVGFV